MSSQTSRWMRLTLPAAVAIASGCVSQSEMLNQRKDGVMQTALQRGRSQK